MIRSAGDDEVELDSAQPAPSQSNRRRPAAPEPERPAPILYIKNLDNLSDVVRRDDIVFQQVDALKIRRNLAWGSLLIGGAAGIVLEAGALTVFAHPRQGRGRLRLPRIQARSHRLLGRSRVAEGDARSALALDRAKSLWQAVVQREAVETRNSVRQNGGIT